VLIEGKTFNAGNLNLELVQQESNRSYSITFVLSEGSLCNLLVQLHIQIHLRIGFINSICQSRFWMSASSSLKIISTSVGLVDLDSS
jgi:hypothetical protein